MTHPIHPDVSHNLAMAILSSSAAPALLLDEHFTVLAASVSFGRAFALDPQAITGQSLMTIADGSWNRPQLQSLLNATKSGHATISAYEMDLEATGSKRRVAINAQLLTYGAVGAVRLLVTIADVTEARLAAKLKDDLLREKAVLLQELQHRVANSLQIIASVLMLSARRVQSEDVRGHLHDAHNRVMSIAKLHQHLTASRLGDIELRGYFKDLCDSLGASMIHDHDRQSITVSTDDSKVTADISVSLGLIVTELVINALKHAFPGERGGTIEVEYQHDAGDWSLSVSDDGVGTDASLAKAKPGLGSGIVDALAGQLDASVVTLSTNPGVTVTVTHKEAAA
ncbi:MAG: sensor histidine kinase [Alteraurantiacibacter sp.]